MSAAVENGVDPSKPRGGVFSRAFAKRAQPYEEGESDDSFWSLPGQVVVLHAGLLPLPLPLSPGAWEDKHRARFQACGVRRAKFPPEIQGTYGLISKTASIKAVGKTHTARSAGARCIVQLRLLIYTLNYYFISSVYRAYKLSLLARCLPLCNLILGHVVWWWRVATLHIYTYIMHHILLWLLLPCTYRSLSTSVGATRILAASPICFSSG